MTSLAHRCKSNDRKGSWSPAGLDEELNSMISENVIVLVDGAYKIKPNQDKNLTNDQNFVEDTQDDSFGKTINPLVIQSEIVITPKSQEIP